MIDFTPYTNQILELCAYRRMTDYPECDVSTAFSMFLGDVKNGSATQDNTAGYMSNVDFAALKAEWDAATDDEKSVALSAIHEDLRRSVKA